MNFWLTVSISNYGFRKFSLSTDSYDIVCCPLHPFVASSVQSLFVRFSFPRHFQPFRFLVFKKLAFAVSSGFSLPTLFSFLLSHISAALLLLPAQFLQLRSFSVSILEGFQHRFSYGPFRRFSRLRASVATFRVKIQNPSLTFQMV